MPETLIATVQWDLLLGLLNPWHWVVMDDVGVEGTVHIRMVRLLRMFRLARASRLINRLTSKRSVHTGVSFFTSPRATQPPIIIAYPRVAMLCVRGLAWLAHACDLRVCNSDCAAAFC